VSAALPLTVLGATQASAGSATTNEDTAVTVTLTARDQTNGLPITLFTTAAAAHGTVGAPGPITCDPGGAHRCHSDVVYTPAANYNGTDTFNFTATGPDGPDTAAITITINPVNDAPGCSGDTSSGNEDTDQTGTVGCTDIDGNLLTYSKVAGPSHGAATVNANGSWTYTPAANYNGSDSFTFRANDGTANSGTATMSLTIAAANDAPTCTDDASIGDKNQQQTGTIVCADVDDDTLTIAKVSGPSHGSASVASDGDWTYTPTINFSGSDSFNFRANDGSLNSNSATMQLTISATNAAPLCTADSSSGAEDTDQTGTVTCSDGDDDDLTYTKVANPTHGTATVDTDGAWTYSPDPDYHGSDSFTFRANDGSVNSTAVAMSITVTSVNDAPACADDTSSGNEEVDQTGTLSCTDVDGDDLAYSKVGDPTDGSVTVDADGDWTYTPDADFQGSDAFTFRANDGNVNSNTATMSIAVNGTNDVPVCSSDTSSGVEDADQTGTVGCTDPDGDLLTYSKVADPTNGSVTVDADGDWTYDPDPNFNGVDAFTFRAGDGSAFSNPATMSITVTAVNDAPACSADSSSGAEDADQTGTVTCTDVEGDFLTYDKAGDPANGTAAVDADGDWTYSPDADFHGSDSFTFRANDGDLNSSAAAMSITVTPVNDRPVCQDLPLTTAKNVAVGGTVSCSDIEGDALVLRIGTQPEKGTVSPFDTSTGGFTYTPDLNTTGADSFTVIANDGNRDSLPALVGIGVDDEAPTCTGATPAAANEDTAQGGNLACIDADGDTLFYDIVDQPAHGTASINTNTGHWTYTPAADFNGSDSFTASATDGALASNAATISVTIDPVNDAPDCTPATSSGDEETPQSGTVSCIDVEGDAITYAKGTGPSKGSLTFDPSTGDWDYTPFVNRTGADAFTFTATDTLLVSAPAIVSITLVDVNDPPVAKNDTKTFNATSTTTIGVTSNDFSGPVVSGVTSEPGDTVNVTAASGATKGSLSIAGNGKGVVYDPRGCATGDDAFSYEITDGHGATAHASVFVTVARPGTNGLSKKPITDTPALSFVTGSTIGSTTPMRLSWCGATSGGAVKAYRVDQSTNGGSSYKGLLKSTKGTSTTRNLGLSTRYRWRAQTTDKKNRTSAYRASLVARLARTEDGSSAIVYTGAWQTHSTSSASGGTERFTSTAGDSATLTVGSTIRAFAIVGPRSSTRGSFQVYVDGVAVATVSEKVSGSTLYRRVLYTRSLTPGTTHTIAIVASGNGRVDLDAILTLGS
jgi:VCBS repeat-containing protein